MNRIPLLLSAMWNEIPLQPDCAVAPRTGSGQVPLRILPGAMMVWLR